MVDNIILCVMHCDESVKYRLDINKRDCSALFYLACYIFNAVCDVNERIEKEGKNTTSPTNAIT